VSFVKGVVCPVKIGGNFDLQPYQNFPPILPGIGIEAAAHIYHFFRCQMELKLSFLLLQG